MKKKFQIVIYALVLAILLIIAAVAMLFLQNRKLKEITEKANEVQANLNANMQTVYVATTEIPAGAQVLEDVNVVSQQIYSSVDDTDMDGDGYGDIYMNADQLGQRARITIKAGAPVQAQMLAYKEVTKDTRAYEISTVNVTTDQQAHDMVDVRVVFPDGTDYIVLSKKEIETLNGYVMNMFLNEDEILRLQSATVDAAEFGARMYTAKYVERTLQDAADPYYPVRQTTIDLIAADPNVLEIAEYTLASQVREALEARLIMQRAALLEGEELTADFGTKIKLRTPNTNSSSDDEISDSETSDVEVDEEITE